MCRIYLPITFFLFLLLVLSQVSSAVGTLRVDEAMTTAAFVKDGLEVSLAVANETGAELSARIKIELLDTKDRVLSKAESAARIERGASKKIVSLKWKELKEKEESDFLWYRLRYRIEPQDSSVNPIESVVALSSVTQEIFELHATTTTDAFEGQGIRVHIETKNPFTKRGVAGVEIEGKVVFAKDDGAIGETPIAKAVTDADGYAKVDLNFPHVLGADDAELQITARREGFTQTIKGDLRFFAQQYAYIQTDKPIYQPGQALRIRALVLASDRHAIADKPATLKIEDPEGTMLFRTQIKTSRFGIASADWTIPENARLGSYSVRIEGDEGLDSRKYVTISRYELPNFTVNTKPDRAYYLPNQNAKVEVRADYLFGQPVKRGRVRVARETEREWNYREQRWKTEEEDVYEGETNEEGKYVARINLKEKHNDLKDYDYRDFLDINYTAYFTDPTTNRTESRRFDLRVTREPIHVYFITDYHNVMKTNLPLTFYVTAFYADGAPAVCDVEVRKIIGDKDNPNAPTKLLRTVRTNRYGVAKVDRLVLNQSEDEDSRVNLKLVARDKEGRAGKEKEYFDSSSYPLIRVKTDKTIYRAGELVKVEITSTEREGALMVEVARNYQSIHSNRVFLRDGRASLVIPYSAEFKDKLTIAAYSDFGKEDFTIGTHSIIFPRKKGLQIEAKTNQDTYRPGEEANVDFSSRDASGKIIETALGVTVFDKAVEERARIDRADGANAYGHLGYLLDKGEGIGEITIKTIEQLDLTKPVPKDFELAAEALLNRGEYFYPEKFSGSDYEHDQARVFAELTNKRLYTVVSALRTCEPLPGKYPVDEDSLRGILAQFKFSAQALRDPWDTPYRFKFYADTNQDILDFISAGADKRFDTEDDFSVQKLGWEYFKPVGKAIDKAVREYHARTGGYIRDANTLKKELLDQGHDLNAMRDRWGETYKFDFTVNRTKFAARVVSSGPDKKYQYGIFYPSDDFVIWTSAIDYFAETKAAIEKALALRVQQKGRFPQDEREFRKVLEDAGVNLNTLRDGWGRAYYLMFRTEARYTDKTVTKNENGKLRTEITPVIEIIAFANIRSRGERAYDDFDAATFSGVVERKDGKAQITKPRYQAWFSDSNGAVGGVVRDTSGAVIPGATLTMTNKETGQVNTVVSNTDGVFNLSNLAPGQYDLRVEAFGFIVSVLQNLTVVAGKILELNVTLTPGGTTETVTVTAEAPQLSTTTSQQIQELRVSGRNMLQLIKLRPGTINVITKSGTSETPRLREYFPETLLWQPEVITDAQGNARLKFKLADNITTWKLAVFGSTTDGQFGLVEKEILAFQPFFVEHDPPKKLTVGDEIHLPVVLRNYMKNAQKVDVSIKPESWFSLAGPMQQSATIAAGDSNKVIFPFAVNSFGKDLKQRVTAEGAEANDAIEREVEVRPNGQEMNQTVGDILNDSLLLETNFPNDAIEGTRRAELKIYPNLMAHVTESIEAVMSRPYGCAEQTISSAYPSVLFLKANGKSPIVRGANGGNATVAKARRYAREGYEKLLGYSAEDGGFTYWGRGDADVALTAYALKFLAEAKNVIEVDEDLLLKTREWLIKKQNADGSWSKPYNMDARSQRHHALLTAYIVCILAETSNVKLDGNENEAKAKAELLKSVIKRALAFLKPRVDEFDEPHLIASYALASMNTNEKEDASRALVRLEKLACNEGTRSYWTLETNTPFYGWGLAGRVETTALVLRALAQGQKSTSSNEELADTKSLINRGLLFLFKQKDCYGVWYSTQATINVLDTLITLLKRDEPAASSNNKAEIFVNNKSVTTLGIPQSNEAASLISVDLSSFISEGKNRIEVKRGDSNVSPASVQLVSSYYVAWQPTGPEATKSNNSSALRFSVGYDKTETRISDEIIVRVETERIGHSGYGMILAEIGLPPGADVDRASLDKAVMESDWAFSYYDVLPDRIIAYLWPTASGVKFSFKFKPRYGIKAQTASSEAYDYYNPEARVVIAPTRFNVK
jgi:hypothetical protein